MASFITFELGADRPDKRIIRAYYLNRMHYFDRVSEAEEPAVKLEIKTFQLS